MDIGYACRTIRAWNDLLTPGAAHRSVPGGLPEAVTELKRYLEAARADGHPIRELEMAEQFLASPEALAIMMPFVFSAESIAAHKLRIRRTAIG